MTQAYRFRPAAFDESELTAAAALMGAAFPHARHLTPAYLAWQYRDNPDGRAIGIGAWHGSEMVGHIAGMAIRARMDGIERRGVFLLNAAVHPEHTRRSIIRTIAEQLVIDAERQGFDFALGMGNALSTRLLTRDFTPPVDRPDGGYDYEQAAIELLWKRNYAGGRLQVSRATVGPWELVPQARR